MFLEKPKTGSPIWNAILKTLDVLEDGFSYKTEMEIQICGSILGPSNIILLAWYKIYLQVIYASKLRNYGIMGKASLLI